MTSENNDLTAVGRAENNDLAAVGRAVNNPPIRIDFLRQNDVIVSFNGRGLLNFERYRAKGDAEEEDGMWGETYKTQYADSKPRGPSPVGLNLTVLFRLRQRLRHPRARQRL